MSTDGRRLRGERTRAAVLDRTLMLASVEGLGGLSLSRVADTLAVSKSGLYAHWRSKEALQCAVIEHAREQWVREISGPARQAPVGVRRLWAAHENRMAFYESDKLPGGCFFANAYSEYNARPGVVRESLSALLTSWMAFLTTVAEEAVAVGDLHAGTDPADLAFLTDALGVYAAMQAPVRGATVTCRRARRSLLSHLRAIATDSTILPEMP